MVRQNQKHFKCHLNLIDSTFEYRHITSVDFIHYQGNGHWHSKGNTILLDFDLDFGSEISRILEGGWFYRDKLIFEYKNYNLILKEHINPEGEVWTPKISLKMKEISAQQYNKLFF